MNEQNSGLFDFIHGYTDGLDDLPDGAYWAMHEAAVEAFNEEFKKSYDWFEVMPAYISWSNKKNEQRKSSCSD